jgi:two-component system, OmpR family, alkaline phosphatase synthesis response regulator PhoP
MPHGAQCQQAGRDAMTLGERDEGEGLRRKKDQQGPADEAATPVVAGLDGEQRPSAPKSVSPPRWTRNEAPDHGTRTAFTLRSLVRPPDGAASVQQPLRAIESEREVRAEVAHPIRSTPLRRGGVSVGGRRLWRCSAGDGGRPDSEESRRGDAKPASGIARRVLVVDDERSIRLLCRVNLIASGMDVMEASNGREGLELARRERPDLVLLDVMMPELDGWTVARELAADEQTREIPIVFLTARADPADRRLGEQLGGVGYVVKPFDPVTIGEFVENVLVRIERGERDQLKRGITSDPDR